MEAPTQAPTSAPTKLPTFSPTQFDPNGDACFLKSQEFCGERADTMEECEACMEQSNLALFFRPECHRITAQDNKRAAFPTELAHSYCGGYQCL